MCVCVCVWVRICVCGCVWLLTPVISLASPLVLFCMQLKMPALYHVGSFRGLSVTKCSESLHVALHCSTTTKVFLQEHSQTGSHEIRPLRENVTQLCLALFEEENGESAKIPWYGTSQFRCDKSVIIMLIFSIWWYWQSLVPSERYHPVADLDIRKLR